MCADWRDACPRGVEPDSYNVPRAYGLAAQLNTMKRTALDQVDPILDSIIHACERLDEHTRGIEYLSEEDAHRLLTNAKTISRHLSAFQRRVRDELGLSLTSESRGRRRH